MNIRTLTKKLKAKYTFVSGEQHGCIKVGKDGLYGFVNCDGNVVIPLTTGRACNTSVLAPFTSPPPSRLRYQRQWCFVAERRGSFAGFDLLASPNRGAQRYTASHGTSCQTEH